MGYYNVAKPENMLNDRMRWLEGGSEGAGGGG